MNNEPQHRKYTGTVAQAGQRGGAIPLSLIFFATFLHQGKKVEYNLLKDAC